MFFENTTCLVFWHGRVTRWSQETSLLPSRKLSQARSKNAEGRRKNNNKKAIRASSRVATVFRKHETTMSRESFVWSFGSYDSMSTRKHWAGRRVGHKLKTFKMLFECFFFLVFFSSLREWTKWRKRVGWMPYIFPINLQWFPSSVDQEFLLHLIRGEGKLVRIDKNDRLSKWKDTTILLRLKKNIVK